MGFSVDFFVLTMEISIAGDCVFSASSISAEIGISPDPFTDLHRLSSWDGMWGGSSVLGGEAHLCWDGCIKSNKHLEHR